jgi:hypothetical protein
MNRGDVVEVDWPFTDLTGTKPGQRSWFRRIS